jgi:undecaprenyl-diphosphatase
MPNWALAVIMGLVEGATEFIPVSSTGHLILAGHVLGFEGPSEKTFDIVIQLGAILAVCWIYRARLIGATVGLGHNPKATRFATNLLIAFLPAAVVGLLAHGFIKAVLFSPWVVATTLFLGGIAILVIERNLPRMRIVSVDEIGYGTAFGIGLFQCISLIPGVSRSGATIMGALLLGTGRVAATEFSFFLAIPIMFAATFYDLWKSRHELVLDEMTMIAIGFATAFVSSLLVVKWLIGFVGRHDFSAFAWYRIAIGIAGFIGLWLVSHPAP